MSGPGFAVVDVETTGFSPAKGDRIVEIGIVHVSPLGEIEGRWETLVNPRRDVGPTRIHGISATDVARAPAFESIAPRVLNLLSGRVLAAHNLAFDQRFLFAELAKVDPELAIEWEGRIDFTAVCTMQLASDFFPGRARSLAACCEAAGIPQTGSHRAVSDALATAQLIGHYVSRSRESRYWPDLLTAARRWSLDEAHAADWHPRGNARNPAPHFVERIAASVDAIPAEGAERAYLGTLDVALVDGYLSGLEQDDLVAAAADLGLDRTAVGRLNRAYLEELAAAAWSDGVLTPDEHSQILDVARALGISDSLDDLVGSAILAAEESTTATETFASALSLAQGDIVVLTGDMTKPRAEWVALLESRGIRVANNVSKKVKLVAAADVETQSGKAERARQLAIPVVSEGTLSHVLASRSR